MGRKGVTADKDSSLGSITRKVVQDFTDMALWVVRWPHRLRAGAFRPGQPFGRYSALWKRRLLSGM